MCQVFYSLTHRVEGVFLFTLVPLHIFFEHFVLQENTKPYLSHQSIRVRVKILHGENVHSLFVGSGKRSIGERARNEGTCMCVNGRSLNMWEGRWKMKRSDMGQFAVGPGNRMIACPQVSGTVVGARRG